MRILIALSFLLANFAQAQITVLGGMTKVNAQADGVYWNRNRPNNMELTPAAVGLRYDRGPLSIQYTYFGKTTTDAMAVTVDAPAPGGYDPATGSCVGTCAPVARWIMQSETQSIAVMGVKHIGPWSLEAGINLFEIKTQGRVVYSSGPDWYYTTERYLGVGPMGGLAYQSAPWSIHAQVWRMEGKGVTGNGRIPVANFNENYQATLMVGYTF